MAKKSRNSELLESMKAMGQANGPYEDWRVSEIDPTYENAVNLAECARQIKVAQAALTMNDPKGAFETIKRVQEALAALAKDIGGKKAKSEE